MPRTSVKSPDAFRTISEAADALDLPQHVLRFWETRFSQIKPMKRSGGRRYYRPADIALLQGIRHLLYEEGYTIKGVQRILREQGIAHVAGLGSSRPAIAPAAEPASTPQVERPASPLTENPAIQGPALAGPAQIIPDAPQLIPNAGQVAPGHPTAASPQSATQPAIEPFQVAQPLTGGGTVAPVQPATTPANAPGQQMPPAIRPPVAQPVQPQQVPVPETPQLATRPNERPGFSPLGGSQASSLRFMPEAEAPPELSVQSTAAHLLPQPQSMNATAGPAAPPVSHQAPIASAQPRLNAQDTETLVKALQTLLDCKAILDSASQPTPNPNSARS